MTEPSSSARDDRGPAAYPLLDEDGWPTLEGASRVDLQLAVNAIGPLATYGNFIRAALAGIYAERRQSPKVSVEAWDGEDEVGASVADVVRIDDTWHVVVTLDG